MTAACTLHSPTRTTNECAVQCELDTQAANRNKHFAQVHECKGVKQWTFKLTNDILQP